MVQVLIMVLLYEQWLERFLYELNAAELQGWIGAIHKNQLEGDSRVLYV